MTSCCRRDWRRIQTARPVQLCDEDVNWDIRCAGGPVRGPSGVALSALAEAVGYDLVSAIAHARAPRRYPS